jgi:hypothetical protein
MRPSTPKCSDSLVASAAASIATGWSEPVPGRELHPLKSSAFHGALFHQSPDLLRFSTTFLVCMAYFKDLTRYEYSPPSRALGSYTTLVGLSAAHRTQKESLDQT